MNISRIHLKNFQSIKDSCSLKLSPITFFYGQNSVGKSAVFDAMNAMNELCKVSNEHQKLSKNIHMYNPDLIMTIGAGFITSKRLYTWRDIYECHSLFYHDLDILSNSAEVDIYFNVNTVDLVNVEIKINNQEYAYYDNNKSSLEINLSHPEIIEIDNYLTQNYNKSFVDLCQIVSNKNIITNNNIILHGIYEDGFLCSNVMIEQWESSLDSGDLLILNTTLSYILLAPIDYYMHIFEHNIKQIGPLRKIPDLMDLYFYQNKQGNIVNSNFHEDSNWYNGSKAWVNLVKNNKRKVSYCNGERKEENINLIDYINNWLSSPDKLDMAYTIARKRSIISYEKVETIGDIFENDIDDQYHPSALVELRLQSIIKNGESLAVDLNNVGAGLSQIIPILVSGLVANQIFIEQPELHLHPKLQTDLGDYFIDRFNNHNVHSVIETHSEYLALRILRRIREFHDEDFKSDDNFKLSKDDVMFYYFDSDGTKTTVTELKVDKDGDFIDRWPKGFFSERERELFDEDF
jgi:AAA15 family ATPase/GTPase